MSADYSTRCPKCKTLNLWVYEDIDVESEIVEVEIRVHCSGPKGCGYRARTPSPLRLPLVEETQAPNVA